MGYFYDFHVHSNECSGCAATPAADMVPALKKAGYSGFVLTNHFLNGNNCVPKELSWEEKMAQYYNAYLSAKKVGDEMDMDVFFGIEYHYANAREILIYGIDYAVTVFLRCILGIHFVGKPIKYICYFLIVHIALNTQNAAFQILH
jgi:histidinol phosphatase-like PHP family hydrolase